MTTVQAKLRDPIKNDNLKGVKDLRRNISASKPAEEQSILPEISQNAKGRAEEAATANDVPQLKTEEAQKSAGLVSKTLAKASILPIALSSESKDAKKLEEKISEAPVTRTGFIKKPAIIFIEGFSLFGLSNGDGIKDMADNLPGAKRFSWNEKESILDEIKKHAPDQPVVLVGHSFGGDSAVEIANTLNSVKNGFRSIDLLVSIDSVGMNNTIIPMNVKRNLNFIGEGIVPFLHGNPDIARDVNHTEVLNELRSEIHSRLDDSKEIQYKIFESINDIVGQSNNSDLFLEMQKNDHLRKIIDSQNH